MSGLPLSPELCHRIVQATSPRHRPHLAVLCRTCKAFQRETEPVLYAAPYLGADVARLLQLCAALTANPRLAGHVRCFCMYEHPEGRAWRAPPPALWHALHAALACMPGLTQLSLAFAAFTDAWVLDPDPTTPWPFTLRGLSLRVRAWDTPLARFLAGQPALEALYYSDMQPAALPRTLHSPASPFPFPALTKLEAPLALVAALVCPALRTLTAYVSAIDVAPAESLPSLPALLERLAPAHGITALSIQVVPATLGATVLAAAAALFPDLAHVGVLVYPVLKRHKLYKPLAEMRALAQIELDATHWRPPPDGPAQRALVAELATFRPTLRAVVLWVARAERCVWVATPSVSSVGFDGGENKSEGTVWTRWTRAEGDLFWGV
ncbi:hypothetical protein B0H10DRAFT_2429244 [Mycena sp. CBHHK59/15]|nr:hypothetical protein B0H10DRAFT_2429244 [Mycena sp. CBHHK59/15]